MVLSWTKKRVFRRAHKGKDLVPHGDNDLEVEIVIPTNFRCPVSLDLMKDPVTLSTGITYDRDSIERWIESGNTTCPVTKQVLTSVDMIPNHVIRRMIQDWCVENRSYGIERIPTPRIPISNYVVFETCSKILSASERGDENKCQELLGKIRTWGKESERNKKCIESSAAGTVLAIAFDSFSSASVEKHVVILEETLGVLTWMLPIGEEGQLKLGSEASLNCLIRFVNGTDFSARQSAALLLKEMPAEKLANIEGVVEALVKNVREPIGASAPKACLATIFNLVSSKEINREEITQRFVESGLVSLLMETIVDGEKGLCEKALGVLDCICDCQKGKEIAKMNALTMPLVIKKILRVSQLANSFAASILWKLCDKKEEGILIEALQVGVFQKLLVMLQLGCDDSIKEKVSDLLKLLNGYRKRAECVDSSLDYKYLKKPF